MQIQTHLAVIAGLGAGPIAALCVAVLVGAAVQRLAGQGFGMLTAPVFAMMAPGYLPATLLLLGFVIGLSALSVDRAALDRAALPPALAGRALGAGLAALLATRLHDPVLLAIVVAGVIYLGIGLSLSGWRVAITRGSLLGAGTVAGVMGTLTAVGAPPMALLYQHSPRREAVAMQNAVYLFGMIVSALALAVVGLVGPQHLVLALALAPALALGLGLARVLAPHLAGRPIRPWALGLAGLAATTLLLRLAL